MVKTLRVDPNLLIFTPSLARPAGLPDRRPWASQGGASLCTPHPTPHPTPQLLLCPRRRWAQVTGPAAPGAVLPWARSSPRHLVPRGGEPPTHLTGRTLVPTPVSLGAERPGLPQSSRDGLGESGRAGGRAGQEPGAAPPLPAPPTSRLGPASLRALTGRPRLLVPRDRGRRAILILMSPR